jgi:ribonuclease R
MKKNKNTQRPEWQSKDPEYQGEIGRYADPIPSRNFILQTLREQEGPLTLDDLISLFALSALSQQSALEKRLGAMVRDGQVVPNRKGAFGPVAQMNAVAGVVQAHRDGFGFLIPDQGGADIFLPPRQMRSLMNGDRALVRVTGTDFKGRPEGSLVEVLERGSREVVGRLHIEQGVSYVIPDNPRVQQDLLIPPDGLAGATHGQMVVAEIVAPPGNRTLPVGRVIEVLGTHLAPGMEITAAIRAHGLPSAWPDEVIAQARGIPDTVPPEHCEGRMDLRDLPLMTIDGADARDFDDAVYCKRIRGGGWALWVAIADVAAYVTPDSPLDKEAANRGNSVYFPQQVLPMLPEKLSNGLCSLNPKVDRLCMVCEMRVQPDGEVSKSRFYEAVMRSQARLIYEDVAAILDNPGGPEAQRVPAAVPHLQALSDLFDAFYAARERRGAIDFESSETKILFGDGRKIDRIVPVQRNRAHRIIEECMVAANVEAAKLVAGKKIPAPYRVHEKPDTVKVQALRAFLLECGLSLGGGEEPQAMDYARLMVNAKARPDQNLVQTLMLRSLMQARYSADNSGHFGLALTHYAHFTSPIRRYPDLLLHRAIKHLIHRRPVAKFGYAAAAIEAASAHCSMTERRADEATRDVVTWLKCEYMNHHVGETYEGIVSGVAPFGLFIELGGLYVEGLVHVSQLKNDYYRFESKQHRLIGENSGRSYGLGDRMRVRVSRVNLDERKIDLEIIGGGTEGGAGKPPSAGPETGPKSGKPRPGKAAKAAGKDKKSGKQSGPRTQEQPQHKEKTRKKRK